MSLSSFAVSAIKLGQISCINEKTLNRIDLLRYDEDNILFLCNLPCVVIDRDGFIYGQLHKIS